MKNKNILIVFLVLIITLIGFTYVYKNKSKLLFKRLLNNITFDNNKEVDNYFTFNIEEDNILNDVSLKISFIDNSTYALINYKNNELLDIGVIEKEDKLYLDLHKYYNNYIELDYSIKRGDINNIISEIFNALNKSLEKSKFVSDKNVNYLLIDSSNKDIVINTFINYLKSSSKFFNSIYKINNKFDYNNLTNILNDIIGNNFKIYINTNKNLISDIIVERDSMIIIKLTIKDKDSYEININDVTINYNIRVKENTNTNIELEYKRLNILEKLEVFDSIKDKDNIQRILNALKNILYD